MEAVPRSVLIDDENYAVKMDSASYLCNDGFIYIHQIQVKFQNIQIYVIRFKIYQK